MNLIEQIKKIMFIVPSNSILIDFYSKYKLAMYCTGILVSHLRKISFCVYPIFDVLKIFNFTSSIDLETILHYVKNRLLKLFICVLSLIPKFVFILL